LLFLGFIVPGLSRAVPLLIFSAKSFIDDIVAVVAILAKSVTNTIVAVISFGTKIVALTESAGVTHWRTYSTTGHLIEARSAAPHITLVIVALIAVASLIIAANLDITALIVVALSVAMIVVKLITIALTESAGVTHWRTYSTTGHLIEARSAAPHVTLIIANLTITALAVASLTVVATVVFKLITIALTESAVITHWRTYATTGHLIEAMSASPHITLIAIASLIIVTLIIANLTVVAMTAMVAFCWRICESIRRTRIPVGLSNVIFAVSKTFSRHIVAMTSSTTRHAFVMAVAITRIIFECKFLTVLKLLRHGRCQATRDHD